MLQYKLFPLSLYNTMRRISRFNSPVPARKSSPTWCSNPRTEVKVVDWSPFTGEAIDTHHGSRCAKERKKEAKI